MAKERRAAVVALSALEISARKARQTVVEKRDFHSLSYRFCGKITLRAAETLLESDADTVTYVPEGVSYATEILDDTRMAVVHFRCDRDIDFRNPAVVRGSERIRTLFERLVRGSTAPTDFGQMALLYELLRELEHVAPEARECGIPERVLLARRALEQRFTDPLLSVSALAAELGVSAAYLRREFGRAYGKSPLALCRELRLGRARMLLESGVPTVAEIAEQCGYASAGYFISDFRRMTGETPGAYRRRIRTEK